MSEQNNIYAVFSTDPVEFNMQALRAKLGISLIQIIRAKGWDQLTAAEHLRITQPRVSDLTRGKIDRFSIDMLLMLIFRAGYAFNYRHGTVTTINGAPLLEMKLVAMEPAP